MSRSAATPYLLPDDRLTLGEAFTWQAQRCAASGATVAAALLDACKHELAETTIAFPQHEVRFGDHLPLRVMAAVHYLAITRAAAQLPMYFPTLGGRASTESHRFRDAVRDALTQHVDTIAEFMSRPPQTNDTGRLAALQLAIANLPTSQPIDLHEVGCSAGLTLLRARATDEHQRIASIGGCDLYPIDSRSVHGRALLSSYIWVDDIARFARLGEALATAQAQPVTVAHADAASYVDRVQPQPGHITVLWQSALEPYLSSAQVKTLVESVVLLAQRLPNNALLAYITWEDAADTSDAQSAFALRLRTWSRSFGMDDALTQNAPSLSAAPTSQPRTGEQTLGDARTTDRVIARGSAHGANLRELSQD